MHKTIYTCDRCGIPLAADDAAIDRRRIMTQTQIAFKFRFLKKWRNQSELPITYELCERCRDSFDKWLEGDLK